MELKRKLLSGTFIPVVIGMSVAAGGGIQPASGATRAENPTAIPRGADVGTIILAACNPCNPCGAACGACNPCNPCNPCAAANPCGACNPCNPCGPCGPCGAGNPCNPCNPCAASPCGAADCVVPGVGACNPCNPCAAASPCNPCNPCAAANPCNPCNPCAAANPCNPCAAANPCNPCGACNPCNPCAAGGDDVELSGAQAKAAYACIRASLKSGYAKSGNQWVKSYQSWTNYATQPYISDTHGGRFVNNYANARGSNYGLYENAGPAPEGTVLAKDSFSVKPNGKVGAGPMFLMEKMAAGFSSDSQDWRYTLIMPNGQVFGTTGGKNSDKVGFCAECHAVVEDQDSRFYLDEAYRRK